VCANTAPTVFDVDENGYVQVLEEDPGADVAGMVRRAALNCPTGAITLIEDEDGED
jgi:ferredoxin